MLITEVSSQQESLQQSRAVVRRKPRAGPLMKLFRRSKTYVFAYGPTFIRYGLVPSMLAVSLYWTEPQPSLWELLNPFTR